MISKIPELPKSNDEYWESAETISSIPVRVEICEVHTKEKFMQGKYKDNRDGTVSCIYCPWGTKLGNNLRLVDCKIFRLS